MGIFLKISNLHFVLKYYGFYPVFQIFSWERTNPVFRSFLIPSGAYNSSTQDFWETFDHISDVRIAKYGQQWENVA